MNTTERDVQPEPDVDPQARRNKPYKIGTFLVLALMVALAAWAWWIPSGVFNPWIREVERVVGSLGR